MLYIKPIEITLIAAKTILEELRNTRHDNPSEYLILAIKALEMAINKAYEEPDLILRDIDRRLSRLEMEHSVRTDRKLNMPPSMPDRYPPIPGN